MAVLFVIGLLAAPVVAMFLYRTRFWWTPGTVLLIAGIIPFTQLDTGKHDEAGVMAGLANFMLLVVGLGLLAYGAILLAISARSRARELKRARQVQPPPHLPVATVVAMSKS